MNHDTNEKLLLKAIELSRLCPPSNKAFSVGAIIVNAEGKQVSSSYSRERVDNEHAEERAIKKALEQNSDLHGCTICSSLEPCHPRLSGKTSCTDLIIQSGISRVVFALSEPTTFVICHGTTRLKEHGIEVLVLSQLASLVEQINEHVIAEQHQTTKQI